MPRRGERAVDSEGTAERKQRQVGLCVDCRYGRIVDGRAGNRYYLCELSFRRADYPKYPSVPVVQCGGYCAR